MEGTQKHWWTTATFVENKSPTSSPTVLDGCMGLSMDFCFFSLSLSLRRWQRWWWWWWCDLSWLRTCPAPIRDWPRSGRSRSKSLSLTSWWCCVSEDAERLMGLRSTMGWGGKRNGQICEETRHRRRRCGWGRFSWTSFTGSRKKYTHKQKIYAHKWHNQLPGSRLSTCPPPANRWMKHLTTRNTNLCSPSRTWKLAGVNKEEVGCRNWPLPRLKICTL